MKSVIAVVAALAGCASSSVPVSNTEAAVVPPERVLDAQFLKPRPASGEVTVKMDRGSMPLMLCPVRVVLNGRAVADITKAEKVTLHLPEGDHLVGIMSPPNCDVTRLLEVKVPVKMGSSATYRIGGSDAARDLTFAPTAF